MKATSSRTDRLAKNIQAVRQFATERSSQESAYLSIEYALEDLEKALESKRLIVRIIGQDATQTKALQQLLGLSTLVQESYQIQTSPLPEYIQRCPGSHRLTLKCDRLNGNQSPQYQLTAAKPQTIGRNPDAASILLPDELNLVSGCHLELQPVAGDSWQVRDPGSRNGTYINGNLQKLQGWHRLQLGDQIGLGSASRATGSATLVFERPADAESASEAVSALFNCDVLCLVTDLSQPLSRAEKQLIAQVSETQIAKLFIIATTPGMGNPEVVQAHWRTMQIWVQEQSYHSWIEQIAMGLQPVAASPQATVLFPHTRPEFEQFCQTLERLAQEKAEEMLLQRITGRLLQEVEAISSLLNQQEATLMQEIQQAEKTLKDLSPSSLKEQIKKASKKVESEKDQFRQVKTDINQSKAGLLDEFREDALPYQLKQFINQLEPTVSDQSGWRTVKLSFSPEHSADLNDVHAAAIQLSHVALTQWAKSEWRKARLTYGKGGLNSLWQRSFQTLNSHSGVTLPDSFCQVAQRINIPSVLQVAVREPDECKIRYKQPGLLGHLGKNLRGQIISTISTLMLVATPFIAGMKDSRALLSVGLIPPIGAAVFLSYRHEKAMKVEEAVEKLHKETFGYYQSVSKDLAEKLAQHLNVAVDAEEQRFWTMLETINEQVDTHTSDLDIWQRQLRAQIEANKKIQPNLQQTVADIQKIKREVAAIAPTMTKL